MVFSIVDGTLSESNCRAGERGGDNPACPACPAPKLFLGAPRGCSSTPPSRRDRSVVLHGREPLRSPLPLLVDEWASPMAVSRGIASGAHLYRNDFVGRRCLGEIDCSGEMPEDASGPPREGDAARPLLAACAEATRRLGVAWGIPRLLARAGGST